MRRLRRERNRKEINVVDACEQGGKMAGNIAVYRLSPSSVVSLNYDMNFGFMLKQ